MGNQRRGWTGFHLIADTLGTLGPLITMIWITLIVLYLAQALHGAAVAVLALSVLATFIVGCIRIYLGVHWPTDVLAGWTTGVSWAL